MPEQKTKISVASENPQRAGIQLVKKLPGVCAIRMMNIAIPRKKSRRRSRTRGAEGVGRGAVVGVDVITSLYGDLL